MWELTRLTHLSGGLCCMRYSVVMRQNATFIRLNSLVFSSVLFYISLFGCERCQLRATRSEDVAKSKHPKKFFLSASGLHVANCTHFLYPSFLSILVALFFSLLFRSRRFLRLMTTMTASRSRSFYGLSSFLVASRQSAVLRARFSGCDFVRCLVNAFRPHTFFTFV